MRKYGVLAALAACWAILNAPSWRWMDCGVDREADPDGAGLFV